MCYNDRYRQQTQIIDMIEAELGRAKQVVAAKQSRLDDAYRELGRIRTKAENAGEEIAWAAV